MAAYLYEPNAAILKAGGQDAVGKQYDLRKLNRNTNLFTSNAQYPDYPGRVFKVIGNEAYNKKSIAPYLNDKKANLSTRNFVDTAAQMKNKLGVKDGGNIYLFGYGDAESKNKVAICVKADI